MLKKLFSTRQDYEFEVAICCIVKNEQYLPEWVAYHVLIGVSRFYIYDNESAISVGEVLKTYVKSGLVEVIPIKGAVMQVPAYNHCLKNYGRYCRWIAFIDADEFIVPKNQTGNLPQFLTAYEDYGGLGVNWLVFGSNGHVTKPDGPQTANYMRRSLKTTSFNEHIKSIIQPRFALKAIDPHHFIYRKKKYSVNENFERFSGAFSAHSSNKIQINHYFLWSKADFIEKKQRGRADTDEEQHQRTINDFYETDKKANMIVDESILEVQLLAKQNLSSVKE